MSASNIASPCLGVGVLVWRNEKLLLGKRINTDGATCWQFPGGHMEAGESVTECAVREVAEESGLVVKQLRHLGFTEKPFQLAQRHYITLFVSCEYSSGEASIKEPEKCAGWQWFDYRQLPSPLFEPIVNFMTQHADLYAQHCAAKIVQDKP